MTTGTKIAVGCGALALVGALMVVAVVLFFVLYTSPKLAATVQQPSAAALNSQFTLAVVATNREQQPIKLDSIDIDDSFLKGFQVVEVDPAPASTMHILNQRSWGFEQAIQPGQGVTVTFTLKAVEKGHFSGDIDVCNSTQDCTTVIGDVVVQ